MYETQHVEILLHNVVAGKSLLPTSGDFPISWYSGFGMGFLVIGDKLLKATADK